MRWQLCGKDVHGIEYSVHIDIVPSIVPVFGPAAARDPSRLPDALTVEFLFNDGLYTHKSPQNKKNKSDDGSDRRLLYTLCGEVLSFEPRSASDPSILQLCISAGGLLVAVEAPRRFFYNSIFRNVVTTLFSSDSHSSNSNSSSSIRGGGGGNVVVSLKCTTTQRPP